MTSAEPEFEVVLRVLGARRTDALLKVGLPYFFASLKVAIPLAIAGRITVGAMAMAMYGQFAVIGKRTTGWVRRNADAN